MAITLEIFSHDSSDAYSRRWKPSVVVTLKLLAPNGNAVTDFEVAGFARIQGTLRAMT